MRLRREGWNSTLLGPRVGPRILLFHSLLVNLKCKSRNLNVGRESTRDPNGQPLNSTKISKTKELAGETEDWRFL